MAGLGEAASQAMRWLSSEQKIGLGYAKFSPTAGRIHSEIVREARNLLGEEVIVAVPDGSGDGSLTTGYTKARKVVDGILEEGEGGVCVFLVDIDVQWPASLSLLFVSLACLMESEDSYDKLRVLALGSEGFPHQLYTLWWPSGVETKVFVVEDGPDFLQQVHHRGIGIEELGDKIMDDMSSSGGKGIVVDFFPPKLEGDFLLQCLRRCNFAGAEVVFPSCPPDASYGFDNVWNLCSAPVYAQVTGNWQASSVMASKVGSSVHLVVRNSRVRSVFDSSTSQVVEARSWLSQAERLAILSWCMVSGVGMSPSKVFVYHCSKEPCGSLIDYVYQGPVDTRTDVANSQLLGFLAGACWYSTFHHDIAHAIRAFVHDHHAVGEAMRQLKIQEIVDDSDETSLLTMMSDSDWVRFHQVLPAVGYDARLANLLIRGNRSPGVLFAKAQLAAVFVVGIENLFDVRDPHGDPGKDCRLPKDLASRGLVWKVLGLLREWHDKYSTMDHRPVIMNAMMQAGAKAFLNEGPIHVLHIPAMQARLCWTALMEALGIESSKALREAELSDKDCDSILRDVWSAFVCQFSFGNPHKAQILDCLSNRSMTRMDETLPIELVRRETTTNEVWGVYYSTCLYGLDGVMAHDWMWIPQHVVAGWILERKLEDPMRELATTYPLLANMEHLQAVDEQWLMTEENNV